MRRSLMGNGLFCNWFLGCDFLLCRSFGCRHGLGFYHEALENEFTSTVLRQHTLDSSNEHAGRVFGQLVAQYGFAKTARVTAEVCVLLRKQFGSGNADFAGVGNYHFLAANHIGPVAGRALAEQRVRHQRSKTAKDFAVGI